MRLKAVIRYDGVHFSGYQVQPNKRTVQAEIEKVLFKMHKNKPVRITASGRTDQGVHAVGQVIHFDTDLSIPIASWKRALNTMLPDDIYVNYVEEVSDQFHARFDVKEKEYRYFLHHGSDKDIFRRNYEYHSNKRLDVENMNKAAEQFVGTHDFTAFCAANSNVKGDKIRTVTHTAFIEDGDKLIFSIKGTGFLYNMVRIIVGTLVEVGLHKRSAEEIGEILTSKDRSKAGKTMPPQGLYLWKVVYSEKDK